MTETPSNINDAHDLEKQLLSLVRSFLSEFKTERTLSAIHLNASLDRDLGIDSLGRVELFLRIENAFSVPLPDALRSEAQTLNDIFMYIQNNQGHVFIQPTLQKNFVETLTQASSDPLTSKTLIEVLIRRAHEDPKRPHLYLQDEFGVEKTVTYGQLLESATKTANGLYELGLKQSETVAIMLPTCEQFFYAFFGVLLAGGIPVPIYPPLRSDRIEEYALREASILNNAEVRVLITFEKVETLSQLLRVFIKSLKTVTTVDLLMASKSHVPHFSILREDAALIQYTSGSTSDPKGVLLSHHNLLSNIRAFGQAVDLKPTDVGVSWLPLYHDMGLIGAWLGSVYHAFPLTVLSPLTFLNRPERWLWAMHYHRATISGGPNFAYEFCIRKIKESDIEGLDLSAWRLAFNGAEAINPKTLERFAKKFEPFGFKAEASYPVYGLAECAVALTFPPLNRKPRIDSIAREPFETEQRAIPVTESSIPTLEFVSCGMPLPEHEIRIVDEKGAEVDERVVGSLQFSGPSAMQGYYHNLEATKAIYFDGWLDSGDFAYMADGEVFITGRKKDLIIKAGRNLYPQEIEETAAQVSGVRKGCVIAFGAIDPKMGTEKLVIVAETSETSDFNPTQIVDDIIEKVSIVIGIPPDEVVLVPPKTIPKTSSGKLQRSLCKNKYLQGKLAISTRPLWLQMTKLFLKGALLSSLQFLQKGWQIIYTGYVGLLFCIFIPVIWLSILAFPRKISATIARVSMRWLLRFTGCPITVIGQKNAFKTHPMIFVANHASYLDSLVLVALLPPGIAFVAKKEVKTWPIVGSLVKKLGFLTVDRIDFSKSLADSEKMIKTVQHGRSLVIFPEGTFTYASGLRPFKLGAFKIAVETGQPLCPIAIQGTRAILRGDSFLLKRGPIKVTIEEPVSPNGTDWNEITRLHAVVRSSIAKHCGELMIDLITAGPDKHHHEKLP